MKAIDKQALLEWLEGKQAEHLENSDLFEHEAVAQVYDAIQSGRFDSHSDSERLLAALKYAHRFAKRDDLYDAAYVDEALSTTTEPTGAERVRELLKNPMAAGSYRVGVLDTCNALGIIIPDKEDAKFEQSNNL